VKNLRFYGNKPYSVAVLHGGPGCPGALAPVARELSSDRGVLEPLQTADTIDGQVFELAAVLRENADLPVILIGWSWGATLGFIFAARNPYLVQKLILVCAAAFEAKYMANIYTDRLLRLSEDARKEVFALEKSIWDSSEEDKSASMARLFELFTKADSFNLLPHRDEVLEYQLDINISVGLEARKLETGGKFLELGKKIECPVVAIHGDYDTHLPAGVNGPLSRMLKDFRFILLEKCGHEPWYEKYARDKFYEVLRKEIDYGLTESK